MSRCLTPCPALLSAARLLIHADDGGGRNASHFESALQRLRARFARGGPHDTRVLLRLQVDDLQGQRLRAIDDAGPLTDLSLSAGTYQVTAILGDIRRGYTLTLAPGASFDLYLRLADAPP